VIVAPFAIEADNRQGNINQNHSIASIPGCYLRGRIKQRIGMGADYARAMGSCPEVPGIQLHINPHKCEWRLIDPLYDDRKLLGELKMHMRSTRGVTIHELQGVESTDGKLDVHRIKTLCREVLAMVLRDVATVVKGPTPSLENIDALPGYYLLNPGLRTNWGQPIYEKDYDAWLAALQRGGQ